MNEHYYAVIMAGGGGTRLWPLSRKGQPKQMLRLFGKRTLFEIAVQRLEGLFSPDHILVVTVSDQAENLKKLEPRIPAENYLIEPMPRGTASVVGLAAVDLVHRDSQAIMAILTADHYIENEKHFRHLLQAALDLAKEGQLVTLGIEPTYPSTGYGYIQRGEGLGDYQDQAAYKVLKFKEKPGEDQARQMLAEGNHDWNSGMFIWRADRILDELERQMPELYQKLNEISDDWGSPRRNETLQRLWQTIQPETIDYGVMEKADRVAVLPASGLGWNDVGSWDSLFEVIQSDQTGNIVIDANHIGIDTDHTLVCDEGSHRLIVTIGVQDLVIVETDNALLVCRKDQAQQVKQVVNLLKENDRNQYL